MATKSSRCWTGYEPVPGKAPKEKGSCRKVAKSAAKAAKKPVGKKSPT